MAVAGASEPPRGLVWWAASPVSWSSPGAFGLERARFSRPEWVIALRYLTWGTFLVSADISLVRPLLTASRERRSGRALPRGARAHARALSVVSALDEASTVSSFRCASAWSTSRSSARAGGSGRRVDEAACPRLRGCAGIVVLALATALLGPARLRIGLGALLMPTTDAAR